MELPKIERKSFSFDKEHKIPKVLFRFINPICRIFYTFFIENTRGKKNKAFLREQAGLKKRL